MKVLFCGDVVGRAGRQVVCENLPRLRRDLALDFVVVNGENAAGGFGITEAICNEFYDAGVDVITTGNHVWARREITDYMAGDPRLLRPHNFPPGTPGRGVGLYPCGGDRQALVLNVMGRLFMDPLDDPFACVERELAQVELGRGVDFVLVDMHAEATSEKMAMGQFCAGRASLVVGSHTHVPTADAMILEGGTAYLTDAGMCGDYDSVIGMEKEEPLRRFTAKMSGGPLKPAEGVGTLCGVYVESDTQGRATRVAPLRLGGKLAARWPL